MPVRRFATPLFLSLIPALVALMLFANPAHADLAAQRAQFNSAVTAAHQGNWSKFQQLRPGLETYALDYFLDYLYLSHRLTTAPGQILDFLTRYEGWPYAELLRSQWLHFLAKRGAWDTYSKAYRYRDSPVLRCAMLRARLHSGDHSGVLEETRELWLAGESQPPMCDPLFDRLYASGLVTNQLIWQRVRLAMAEGNTSLAGYLARKLPTEEQAWVSLWRDVHNNSAKNLDRPALRRDDPMAKEIIIYGIKRLARSDAEKAAARWRSFQADVHFSEQERAAVIKRIATQAARQESSIAEQWLDAVPTADIDASVQRWQIMLGLEKQDWSAIERWTSEPPHPGMTELRWRYWRARALEKLGRQAAAQELYQSLANERDYYGFLAADRLGTEYQFRHSPVANNQRILTDITAKLERAREFYHHGMRLAARREWQYAITGLDRSGLEHAALLANQLGWHDRAILTMGKAESYDDLELRFPMPYQELLLQYAKRRNLEPAFVFSIVRSESAFMEDAISASGALGLMQVMPATGRHTAKQIGFNLKRSDDLRTAHSNVPIGSAYLRMMIDRFQGNTILATSAYNAGPHRVERWLPQQQCVPADIWIDTIPIQETRRYTRRNVFYTALYQWRLGGPVTAISKRMRPIMPKNVTSAKSATCSAMLASSRSTPTS
jgi:soluble lytic murein transglycosylase